MMVPSLLPIRLTTPGARPDGRKRLSMAASALLVPALFGCAPSPGADVGSAGTGAGGGAVSPPSGPTWSDGISEIFQRNCVRCHASGRPATYVPLQTYRQVADVAFYIERKIQPDPDWGVQMPPYPGGEIAEACVPSHEYDNDLRLPAEDVESLLTWIESDVPEGAGRFGGEPFAPPPPSQLAGATEHPFEEGYIVSVGASHPTGHKDEYVCVIADLGASTSSRFLSGMHINPGDPLLFRGAVVWLDRDRDSLSYVQPGSPRLHGERWYECTDGFGFEGDILGSFLPGGEPLVTPAGSAVEVTGEPLIVYRIHYHSHYDRLDPNDATPLPSVLEWHDHTSLSLRWEEPDEISRAAFLITFGNDDGAPVGGTGNLTPPFSIPVASPLHVESMVTVVPGTSADAYAVWAVQPELRSAGRMAAVSVSRPASSSTACLAAHPRWDPSWQVPLTFDTTGSNAPIVYGGDTLQIDCSYEHTFGTSLTLADESCRAMVGLVRLDGR